MADDCEDIEIGSEAPCPESLPIGALRARLGLININDLDDDEPFTTDGEGRITAVNMKSGKVMKLFTGFRVDFGKTDEVINLGTGPNQLKHGLKFMIYERVQEQKNNINKMIRATVVALTIYKGNDGDAIELLGKKCGLQVVPGPIRDTAANGGYFTINMATLEGEFETELPPTVGGTYADGVAIFDGLLTS